VSDALAFPPAGKRRPRAAAYVPDDPLLTAAESAPETGRALSTFWRDVKRGTLPAPLYVGKRMPRWRRSELRAAVAAAPRGRGAA
jgi:predicted DNA-binding transcriptional regulator AlpA